MKCWNEAQHVQNSTLVHLAPFFFYTLATIQIEANYKWALDGWFFHLCKDYRVSGRSASPPSVQLKPNWWTWAAN